LNPCFLKYTNMSDLTISALTECRKQQTETRRAKVLERMSEKKRERDAEREEFIKLYGEEFTAAKAQIIEFLNSVAAEGVDYCSVVVRVKNPTPTGWIFKRVPQEDQEKFDATVSKWKKVVELAQRDLFVAGYRIRATRTFSKDAIILPPKTLVIKHDELSQDDTDVTVVAEVVVEI
jgi:hypothetical protein